jgi:hypothetical protein
MEGTMIGFKPGKLCGFVRTGEGERLRGDESGFATGTLFGDRCRGTWARFERTHGEQGGARAVGVALVPLLAVRRAWARGRR